MSMGTVRRSSTTARPRSPSLFGAAALAACLLVEPASAQQEGPPELTPELTAEMARFFNAQRTSRFHGPVRISRQTRIMGDLAVLRGPLLLDGTVTGSVLVLNGDATIGDSARVGGDLVLTAGQLRGDSTRVAGDIRIFPEQLRYRESGDTIVVEPVRELEPVTGVRAGREFGFGRTDLTVAIRDAYNRVEGLPLAFGPRVRLGHSNPTVVEGLALYRSEAGLPPDAGELGWVASVAQYLGGHRRFSVGLTTRSEIVPIEEVGISDSEASLATFLLHRDYRDHYERRGWAGHLAWTDPGRATSVRLEYRDERHTSVAAGDPLSVVDNGEPYRPQPVIAEGELNSVVLDLSHDSRNDPDDPSSGWWLDLTLERGTAGNLVVPVTPLPGRPPEETPDRADEHFSEATLDVRRYARLGPTSRVALRALATGSVDGGPLPPQRQHALGGEGTLPGYELFELDCGARRASYEQDGQSFFPYYGCDRAVLVQLAFEQSLTFVGALGRRLGLDFDLGAGPALSLFLDAGRGWVEDDVLGGRGRGEDDFVVDAGAGLRLGRIGVYWAFPLSGRADGVNMFVRLGPRL